MQKISCVETNGWKYERLLHVSLCLFICIASTILPTFAHADAAFVKAFRLQARPVPTTKTWEQFAKDFLGTNVDAFRQLKPILDGLELPNEDSLVNDIQPQGNNLHNRDILAGTIAGFQVFARMSQIFRADLANYALSLPPSHRTQTTSLVFLCLTKSCQVSQNGALVDTCQSGPNDADTIVFKALFRHRAYHEGVTLGFGDLGDDIRKWLDVHATILFAQSAPRYLTSFRYVLVDAPKIHDSDLTSWPDQPSIDHLNEWDNKYRQTALNDISQEKVIKSLDWDTAVNNSSTLDYIQDTLLGAYFDNSLPNEQMVTEAALLKHLERACQLWSNQFHTWSKNSTQPATYDRTKAHLFENRFRSSVVKLNQQHFLLDPVARDYLTWISICGGWSGDPTTESDHEKPVWLRAWNNAAISSNAPKLPIAEGIAPNAFLRYLDPLADPDESHPTGIGNYAVDDSNLTSSERVIGLAEELAKACKAQGIVPSPAIDLSGKPLDSSNPLISVDSVLPRNAHSRVDASSKFVPLHQDQRRALRDVMAAYYVWRADIEYRQAGAKFIGHPLDPNTVENARRLYSAAKSLLPEVTASEDPTTHYKTYKVEDWAVGLGMFGRCLDLQASDLVRECDFRLSQLNHTIKDNQGHEIADAKDYFNDAKTWPASYEGLAGYVTRTLNRVKTLQDQQQNQNFVKPDLDLEVQVQTESFSKAQDLADAANSALQAERYALAALKIQQDQQKLRTDIADHASKEKDYDVDAAKAAMAAQTDLAQAKQILATATKEEEELLKSQAELLERAIDQSEKNISPLIEPDGGQLKVANDALAGFEDKARADYKANHQSSFWGTFLSIAKPIASIVSVYFEDVPNSVGS